MQWSLLARRATRWWSAPARVPTADFTKPYKPQGAGDNAWPDHARRYGDIAPTSSTSERDEPAR